MPSRLADRELELWLAAQPESLRADVSPACAAELERVNADVGRLLSDRP